MDELKIAKIEAWACEVPLGAQLDFGAFQVSSRKHTIVRVSTTDGLVAELIGQSRGAPVDVAILDVIAPLCIGQPASKPVELREYVERSLSAMELDGTIGRAWSLVEICVNDLQAQAADQPLWMWMGGVDKPRDVLIVEGYALVGEDDNQFAERIAARASEGYRLIKLEVAHYQSTDELLRRLAACSAALPNDTRLVLDYAWAWSTPDGKGELLAGLESFNIAWLEDIFPRTNISAYLALRKMTNIPIGCGDETTRSQDVIDLISAGALDVVRMDATTFGGIHQCRRIADAARNHNLLVSFHDHPEIHEHLVFGLDCTDHVEVFPVDRPFDRVHELWHSTLFERISNGRISAAESAGTGIRLRDENVAKYAVRQGSVGT